MLAAMLGLITRATRPQAYSTVAAVAAVALALAYLSLEVRTLYHGPVLTGGPSPTPSSTPIRPCGSRSASCCWSSASSCARSRCGSASAAVVMLTMVKVFLVDMADLTGIWQALSFIGLGSC